MTARMIARGTTRIQSGMKYGPAVFVAAEHAVGSINSTQRANFVWE